MSLIRHRKKLSVLFADFERWIHLREHPDRGEKLSDCAWALRGFLRPIGEDPEALARLLAIEVQLRTRPGPGAHGATDRILEILFLIAEDWRDDRDEEAPAPGARADLPPPETLALLCQHARDLLGWVAFPRDPMAGRRRAIAWEILREAAPRGDSLGLLPLAVRAVGRAGVEEAVTALDFVLTWCGLASLDHPLDLDAAVERLRRKAMRPSLQRRLEYLVGDDPR